MQSILPQKSRQARRQCHVWLPSSSGHSLLPPPPKSPLLPTAPRYGTIQYPMLGKALSVLGAMFFTFGIHSSSTSGVLLPSAPKASLILTAALFSTPVNR